MNPLSPPVRFQCSSSSFFLSDAALVSAFNGVISARVLHAARTCDAVPFSYNLLLCRHRPLSQETLARRLARAPRHVRARASTSRRRLRSGKTYPKIELFLCFVWIQRICRKSWIVLSNRFPLFGIQSSYYFCKDSFVRFSWQPNGGVKRMSTIPFLS